MPAIEDKFLKPPVRFPPNLVVSRRLDYAELPHGPEQVCSPQRSAMRHNPTYGIMPGLVLLRVAPGRYLFKWARLDAAVQRFGQRLFGRYVVIEEARFRSRPLPGSTR
jgi:hypothetical protein